MVQQQARQDAQSLAQQYLEEIKHQLQAPVDEVPPARDVRSVYWIVGCIVAATVLALEIALLVRPNAMSGLPVPSQELIRYEAEACTQRQKTIMDAVKQYGIDHGEPPPNLAALKPQYLSFSPVDPISGRAYGYGRQGKGAWISCPDGGLHPSSESRQ